MLCPFFLVSKLGVALFRPGWFRHKPSAKLEANVAENELEGFKALLYERDRTILAKLESTQYRIKMQVLLENIVVIGPALGKMMDSYHIKAFRFDQWVQKLASDSDPLWLITLEKKDPLQLSDEILAKAGLQRDQLESKSDSERDLELYTRCTKQSRGGFVIEQELNKKIIKTSEEPVTPYLRPGYIEVPGENYSRGFVEERLGDLRSYNGLNRAILIGTTAAAKVHPVIDESKGFRVADLMKKSGTILTGRVVGGVVDGVGYVRVDKNADFSVAMNHAAVIEKRLGKQFLLETEAQPEGERVTKYQVQRIARQLEGALGGVYTHIADELQRPLIERTEYQMQRDGLLQPLPKGLADEVEIELLTGVEALSRQGELERLGGALEFVAQIPGAVERINWGAVTTDIFRGFDTDADRYIKSEAQIQAERQAVMQQQLQAVAGEQAAKTAGAVVEGAAGAAQKAGG